MGSWISKAASVFRKEGPAPPPQFELACECGQSHSGIRRSRHQHIVCKACGASMFVLPKDVYPAAQSLRAPAAPAPSDSQSDFEIEASPVERPSKGKKNKTKGRGDGRPIHPEVAEAVFEESGDAVPVIKPPERRPQSPPAPVDPIVEQIVVPPSKRKKGAQPASKRRRKRDQELEDEIEEDQRGPGLFARMAMAVGLRFSSSMRWVRAMLYAAGMGFLRFWTPLRLTLLAVALMITSAIAFTVRQGQRETAAQTIRDQTDVVAKAIEEKEWLTARRELEPVVAALDRLGREDHEAQAFRQQFRETTAITQLSGESLYELLSIADDTVTKSGPQAWQDKFRTLHAGKWFVVEGPVEQITERVDGQISRGFVLSVPWGVGGQQRPVVLRVDLDQFRTMRIAEEPTPVIFAAPLKACRLDPGDDEWRVEFDGGQGFLWANPVTYQALGFTYDSLRSEEQINAMLKTQTGVMGVQP